MTLRSSWGKVSCPVLVAGPYRKKFIQQDCDCASDTKIKSVFDDANYKAAKKGGDIDSAMRICERMLDKAYLVRLRMEIQRLTFKGYSEPILVAPCKPTSQNRLAKAAANYLGKKLNLNVDDSIQEVPCSSRHDMDCRDKFLQRPEFTGAVEKGRLYILVDDMITTGGTLAELRSYIVKNGGHVALACSLGSQDGLDRELRPRQEDLEKVEKNFRTLGEHVFEYLKSQVGLTLDTLTREEAKFFGSHKGRSTLLRHLDLVGK